MRHVTYKQYGHVAVLELHGKPYLTAERHEPDGTAEYWQTYFIFDKALTVAGGPFSLSANDLDKLAELLENFLADNYPEKLNGEHQSS